MHEEMIGLSRLSSWAARTPVQCIALCCMAPGRREDCVTVPASCALVQLDLSIVVVIVIGLYAAHAQVVSRVLQYLSGICRGLQIDHLWLKSCMCNVLWRFFGPSAHLLKARDSTTQSIKTQTQQHSHPAPSGPRIGHIQLPPARACLHIRRPLACRRQGASMKGRQHLHSTNLFKTEGLHHYANLQEWQPGMPIC